MRCIVVFTRVFTCSRLPQHVESSNTGLGEWHQQQHATHQLHDTRLISMKRSQRWIVIAGALGSIFAVGFAAREMLFAQQNHRPQNDKWGPNTVPLPAQSPNRSAMPATVMPGITPPQHAISPNPGGPTAPVQNVSAEQWSRVPQAVPPSHPNPTYPPTYPAQLPSISSSTGYVTSGYLPSPVHVTSGAHAAPGVSLPPNNVFLSPGSHSNTFATSQLLQQYAACDDEAKKEELVSQIKKLVTEQFEEKHAVTKRFLEMLEKTTQKLRDATEKREANKDKIIADRVASLVGRIDGTAWDFDEPSATEIRGIELPRVLSPALGTMSAPAIPANFPPPQMMFLSPPNHHPAQPYSPPSMPNHAYAPYPPAYPAYPTPPQPLYIPPGAHLNPPGAHLNPPGPPKKPGDSSVPTEIGPASLLPTDPSATPTSEATKGSANEDSSLTPKTPEPSE